MRGSLRAGGGGVGALFVDAREGVGLGSCGGDSGDGDDYDFAENHNGEGENHDSGYDPGVHVSMGGEMENPLKTVDKPLISDGQWSFIRSVLARPEVMTLVVLCEVPLVWEVSDNANIK